MEVGARWYPRRGPAVTDRVSASHLDIGDACIKEAHCNRHTSSMVTLCASPEVCCAMSFSALLMPSPAGPLPLAIVWVSMSSVEMEIRYRCPVRVTEGRVRWRHGNSNVWRLCTRLEPFTEVFTNCVAERRVGDGSSKLLYSRFRELQVALAKVWGTPAYVSEPLG